MLVLTDGSNSVEFNVLRQEHYKMEGRSVDSVTLEITDQDRIDTDQKYHDICLALYSLGAEMHVEQDGQVLADMPDYKLDRITREYSTNQQIWRFRVSLTKWS